MAPDSSRGKPTDHGGRRRLRNTPEPGAAARFLVPFAVVVYLGMESGGFDTLVRGQVGIAAWWIALLGLIAGINPAVRIGRTGWIATTLLAGFVVWTITALAWSSSAEQTMIEAGRVASYLGIFLLAMLIAGRDRLRPMLAGVGTGCAAIATVALLSRLEPNWFPEVRIADALPTTQSRLAYPLNYWNALAGLTAVGLPLIVWLSVTARSLPVRGGAAALAPMMALTAYYTFSRGGIIACFVGVVALVALSERRLSLIPTLSVLAVASAGLIWAAEQRPSLRSGLVDQTALAEGDQMLVAVIGGGVVVGVLIAGIGWAVRRGRLPEMPAVSRRVAVGAAAIAMGIAILGFLLGGGPQRLSEDWETFKQPDHPGAQADRLSSASGNGRWQYWSGAVEAFTSEPIHGIGPGTFVYFWSQHKEIPGFIRDAHSLFAEVLGELGIVGLTLIGGFVLLALVTGVRRSFLVEGRERQAMAAATASALAFTIAAGIDWLWEIAVIPIAFLWIAAAIVRAGDERPAPIGSRATRIAVAGIATIVAAAAIAVTAIPMYGSRIVAESQAAFRAGDFNESLSRAKEATGLQPYAATPLVQQAFAYERLGNPAAATAVAHAATDAEPTNWETWWVLSRQRALLGRASAARAALRRAQELNPMATFLDIEGASHGGRGRTEREPSRSEDGKSIALNSATDFDPASSGGDGDEHAADTSMAIDGDPNTAWSTEDYYAGLDGIPKDGVGIYVDAGKPVTPSRMQLRTGGGGRTYEIHGWNLDTPPADLPAWGPPLTRELVSRGRQIVDLNAGEPHRYFLIWITGIDRGRATIYEIRLLE